MTGEESSHDEVGQRTQVAHLFRLHRRVFVAAMITLVVVNVVVGGGWWSFWPMCVWGLVFSLHFFYYKSITVDESWVQERTDDMRLRSYDLSHIHDIEDRVEHGDSSVVPPSEWKP